MSSLEFTKMAMAVLIAGIVAMVSGFIARGTVSPTLLEKNVYIVDLGVEAEPVIEEAVAEAPSIASLLASADAGAGQGLSRACAACHTFDKGGATRIGPNLWNIVNRPLAAVDGFSYSSALSDKGGNWTIEALDGFIAAPRDWVPDTKMSYAGMRSPQDRANLIAWLRSLGEGAAVPAEPAVKAEPVVEPAPAVEAGAVVEAAPPVGEPTSPETLGDMIKIGALLTAADPGAGQRLSRPCAVCHSFDKGGATRIGPNLWNIVNRPLATVDGFSYSSALSGKGGTWSYEELDGFIAAPRNWVSGTKMTYAGMRSAEDRANLIAWLRSLSDSPAPLPE